MRLYDARYVPLSVITAAADSSVVSTCVVVGCSRTQSAVEHVCFHTTSLKSGELAKMRDNAVPVLVSF